MAETRAASAKLEHQQGWMKCDEKKKATKTWSVVNKPEKKCQKISGGQGDMPWPAACPSHSPSSLKHQS